MSITLHIGLTLVLLGIMGVLYFARTVIIALARRNPADPMILWSARFAGVGLIFLIVGFTLIVALHP